MDDDDLDIEEDYINRIKIQRKRVISDQYRLRSFLWRTATMRKSYAERGKKIDCWNRKLGDYQVQETINQDIVKYLQVYR